MAQHQYQFVIRSQAIAAMEADGLDPNTVSQDEDGMWGYSDPEAKVVQFAQSDTGKVETDQTSADATDKPKRPQFKLTVGKLILLLGHDESIETGKVEAQTIANRAKAPVMVRRIGIDGLEQAVATMEPVATASGGRGERAPTEQQQIVIDLCSRKCGASGEELRLAGVGGNSDNGKKGLVAYKKLAMDCQKFGYNFRLSGRTETRINAKGMKSEILAHIYHLDQIQNVANGDVDLAEAAD